MNSKVCRLLRDHRDLLEDLKNPTKPLARRLGVTEWTVRQARQVLRNSLPLPSTPGNIHLVVGDAHDEPGVAQDRFLWLGRLMRDLHAEAEAQGVLLMVILMGDVASISSLSHFDRKRAKAEGRRLQDDYASYDRVHQLIREGAGERAYHGAVKYQIGGNHDCPWGGRPGRYAQDSPELYESPTHLHVATQAEAMGWSYVPFLQPLVLDGVAYCHYLQATGTGKAVRSVNQGRTMVLAAHQSVTVGHNHILDHYVEARLDGTRINALSAGCYFEHDEDYAVQGSSRWWRGLVIKRGVRDGDYALTTLRMEDIRRAYGGPHG